MISDGPSSELTPTRIDALSLFSSVIRVSASERVDVGGVVADVQRSVDVGVLEERRDPGALVDPYRRANLEYLASPMGLQSGVACLLSDLIDRGVGGVVVGRAAPVERDDRPLVLEPDA